MPMLRLAELNKVVLLFDFDRTIFEGDSDNEVVVGMGISQLFEQLNLSTLSWDYLQDNNLMLKLHSKRRTIEEIEVCLKEVHLSPKIMAAIEGASAFGCDLRIISDANQFFIETILKQHGLSGQFSKIHTNPTSVNDQGRLMIFPYHHPSLAPHGCPLCSPTMCKGQVIEQIKAAPENRDKKIVYISDGKSDICPSLKLGPEDLVMPRKNFSLWNFASIHPGILKAEILEWHNGENLKKRLIELIARLRYDKLSSWIQRLQIQPQSKASHQVSESAESSLLNASRVQNRLPSDDAK